MRRGRTGSRAPTARAQLALQLALVLLLVLVRAGTPSAAPAGAGAAAGPGPATPAIIALLPLDAEPRLTLYGQPVAAEVARALSAEGLEVVVVGAGAPVPARAALVVDGTIKRGERGAIWLEVGIRDPEQGQRLGAITARAPSLTAIDAAAADLAARLVPEVRVLLAARAAAARSDPGPDPRPPTDPPTGKDPPLRPKAAPPRPTLQLRVSSPRAPELVAPLTEHLGRLGRRLGWAVSAGADGPHPAGARLQLDVLAVVVKHGHVPTARVRCRVRAFVGATRVFDGQLRTDTLVGRARAPAATLAAAAAVQLADILAPRLAALPGLRR